MLPKSWNLASETMPAELYVEGIAASGLAHDVELELEWADGTRFTHKDKVVFTVVQADLNIDGVPDEHELPRGDLIAVNDDDDNDGSLDYLDVTRTSGEDDLKRITLNIKPPGLMVGTLTLMDNSAATLIKVWQNSDRSGNVNMGPPPTWDLATQTPPSELFVEGVVPSAAERDVELRLQYDHNGAQQRDDVTMTVVDVEIDALGVADIDEEDPGALVPLNIDRDEGNTDANGNPLPDRADVDILNGAGQVVVDDLQELTRAILPLVPGFLAAHEAKLTISANDIVRVWAVDPGMTAAEELPLSTDLIPQYFGDTAPRKNWLWYAEGIECGAVTVTITLSKAAGGATVADDVLRLAVVGAQVQSVEFGGANHTVTQDGGTAYTGADWADNDADVDANDVGEHRFPVAYTRNTSGTLNYAVFMVCPDTFPSGPTNVRGVDSFGNEYLAGSSAISVAGSFLIAFGMTASAVFPNDVRYLGHDVAGGAYVIVWSISGDNGTTWYPAGETDNPLFLLLNNPSGPYSTLYETVGWISCRNAAGATDADGVFTGSWGEFTDLDVRRKPLDGYNVTDGQRLAYWRGGSASATTVSDLLKEPTGNGQCGAWAELLITCAGVHGVASAKIEIEADAGANPGATGFLVKNWLFGTPSATGHYPYLVWTDVVELPGIGGQDNPDPPAAFANHFVARYNSAIYDPSYGAGPFSPDSAHENAAIDGILTGTSPPYWARPQDPAAQELDYTTVP